MRTTNLMNKTMITPRLLIASVALAALGSGIAQAQGSIIGISAPPDAQESPTHAALDGGYSVQAPPFPFPVDYGVGYLINPTWGDGYFGLHSHVYSSPNIPDPATAVITFQFDMPVTVDQLEVIQHGNGITRVEAFVGSSLGTLGSVGSVFGLKGDVTGSSQFGETESDLFDFDNTIAGTYLQLVIRKTSLENGWAAYRIFPRTADGDRIEAATAPIPEPTAYAFVGGLGLVAFAAFSRRRKV